MPPVSRVDAIQILRCAADLAERGECNPISNVCDVFEVEFDDLLQASEVTGVLLVDPRDWDFVLGRVITDETKRDRCLEVAQLLEDEETRLPDPGAVS